MEMLPTALPAVATTLRPRTRLLAPACFHCNADDDTHAVDMDPVPPTRTRAVAETCAVIVPTTVTWDAPVCAPFEATTCPTVTVLSNEYNDPSVLRMMSEIAVVTVAVAECVLPSDALQPTDESETQSVLDTLVPPMRVTRLGEPPNTLPTTVTLVDPVRAVLLLT